MDNKKDVPAAAVHESLSSLGDSILSKPLWLPNHCITASR
jgi:hypothetical protein